MASRVERRTYPRFVPGSLLCGLYFAGGVIALVFFLNPYLPASPGVLAYLSVYLIPAYTLVAGGGLLLLAAVAQPFVVRPLVRRILDPLYLSGNFLIVLLVLSVVYWLNVPESEFLLSARQHRHLLKASAGLTVGFALTLLGFAVQRLYPSRRRAARLFIVGVLVALPVYLVDQRRISYAPLRRHTLAVDVAAKARPLKVLGIDGLSLEILRPLCAAGKLPNFSRLLAEGASGRLRTIVPTEPAATWTTLATGMYPYRHQVTDNYVYSFAGTEDIFRVTPRFVFFRKLVGLGFLEASPVLSSQRRGRPVWEVLQLTGIDTGIVNFPVTYPSTRIPRFTVSDYFTKPYFQHGRALARVTSPERLLDLALQYRVTPEEIPDPLVESLLGPPARTEQDDRLRGRFRAARARDLSVRAVAWLFAISQKPTVLLVRLEGLEEIERYFLKHHQPASFGLEGESRYRRAVTGHYEFLDTVVGEHLAGLPEGGMLMVVSASGVQPLRIQHRLSRPFRDPLASGTRDGSPEGALLVWGRDVPAEVDFGVRSIVDVTPTILYAQGLPIARDMDGMPIFEAFTDYYKSRTPLSLIKTYDAARFPGKRRPQLLVAPRAPKPTTEPEPTPDPTPPEP